MNTALKDAAHRELDRLLAETFSMPDAGVREEREACAQIAEIDRAWGVASNILSRK